MSKIIYNYHALTREYLGSSTADPDPMNPGSWLLPAHSTEIAPAEAGEHQVAVYADNSWALQADYRGEIYYKPDRTLVEITELNVEPDPTWTTEPAPLTIPELITIQLGEINADCEQAIALISAGYPDSEVLSWPKQETEARAWLANNSAATPLIDALASTRGVDKADLVGRIIAKADAFAQESGELIGKRQGLEDQLMAMKAAFEDPELPDPTLAEIEAVVW